MTPSSQIREHMSVYGSDGALVGVVDRVEDGGRIKLTKADSADGQHHFIDSEWIDRVDDHVHLNRSGDDVTSQWLDDEELDLEDDFDADDLSEIEQSEEQKQEEWIERRR